MRRTASAVALLALTGGLLTTTSNPASAAEPALDTILDYGAPDPVIRASRLTFTFHSTHRTGTLWCSLNGAAETKCDAPTQPGSQVRGWYSFRASKSRVYTLRIQAADANGARDATPIELTWTVDADKPAKPTDVTITETGTNSLAVAWTASTSADLNEYRVWAVNKDAPVRFDTPGHASTTKTEATVSNLNCGDTYKIVVSAIDQVGNRNDTEVTAPTLPCPADLALASITGKGVLDGWILNWAAPTSPRARIIGYEVLMAHSSMAEILPPTARSFIPNDEDLGFDFAVRAVTADSRGEWAEPTVRLTKATVTSNYSTITEGNQVKLTGRVTSWLDTAPDDFTDVTTGRVWILYRKVGSNASWSVLKGFDLDGPTFTAYARPSRKTEYHAYYEGSLGLAGTDRRKGPAVRIVSLRPAMTVNPVEQSVKVGTPATWTGSVDAKYAGTRIEFAEWDNPAIWRKLTSATVAADGTFTVTWTPAKTGTHVYGIRIFPAPSTGVDIRTMRVTLTAE